VKQLLSRIALVALVLGLACGSRAQTRVTLLTPDPIKGEIDQLVKQFEAKSGIRVQTSYGTGVGTRKTVSEGGALDVTLLFAPFDEALKTGNLDIKTQTVVARLRLAIAVKKGAPKPDISTVAKLAVALKSAKAVMRSNPASRTMVALLIDDLLKRLGSAPVVVPVRTTFYGMKEIGVREPGGNIVLFAAPAQQSGTH